MAFPFLSLAVAGALLQPVSPAASTTQPAELTPGASAPIVEIHFAGNKKTRPETLLREMFVKIGDPANEEAIERSRQAIMDLELFKSVRAALEPAELGSVLVITVEEKRYLFLLPALSRTSDGDISYGVQARIDNLWGRDHRFDVEVKRKNLSSDADVDNERTQQIRYRYPRIHSGPWELDTRLRVQRALLEEDRGGATGEFDRETTQVELLASRWRKVTGASRGWRFGAGVSYEDFVFKFIEGDPSLFFDTTEIGLLGRFGFHDVRNFEFNRSGRDFTATLDGFTKALGSAKDRLIWSVGYRSYTPVTRRRYTNLNYQLRAAMASQSLFGDPTFDVAGGGEVRGYPRQTIQGAAYLVGNIEFVTPISKLDALRGVVFADVGDAFGEPDDATLAHLKTAAGLGLRWKVRAFVRVDLRIDVARGFDTGGETKVYAGTDATF